MKQAFKFVQPLGTVVLNVGESFTSKEFFSEDIKKGEIRLWSSHGFNVKVLGNASAVIDPVITTIGRCKTAKNIYDSLILFEMGSRLVFSVDKFLVSLKGMLSKQMRGQVGDLLTNNLNNLFYIQLPDRVVIARVRWFGTGWRLYCAGLDEFGKINPYHQIFTPEVLSV